MQRLAVGFMTKPKPKFSVEITLNFHMKELQIINTFLTVMSSVGSKVEKNWQYFAVFIIFDLIYLGTTKKVQKSILYKMSQNPQFNIFLKIVFFIWRSPIRETKAKILHK